MTADFYFSASTAKISYENIITLLTFFNTNINPFSLMYYTIGYVPLNLSTTDPSAFYTRALLVALQFKNPTNPSQLSFNSIFSKLFAGFTPTYANFFNVPYVNAIQLVDSFFPYGFCRGLYGPQTTKISAPYLKNITMNMKLYIQSLVDRGEDPATLCLCHAVYVLGLNGHLLTSNPATV